MSAEDRTDDVESMRRLYRLASQTHSQAHDAGPDPRVRATVLAAAARAVESKPRGIGTRFPTPARTRRWPLSAAAVVVVSVMTGLVVTRTMEDDPRRVGDGAAAVSGATTDAAVSSSSQAPAARTVPKAETGFVPSPPTAAAKPKAVPSREVGPPSPAVASSSRSTVPAEPARARSTLADRVPVPVVPSAPPVAAAPAPPSAATPLPRPASPAPPAAVAAPSPSTPARDDGDRFASEAAVSRDAKASGEVGRQAASPPGLQGSALLRARTAPQPATPEAWLVRIAALRAAGRDADADREVDALHARYPAFAIPDEARRPAGP